MLGITQGRGVGDDTRVLSERRGDDAMHPMGIDCRHRSIAAFVDIFSPHKGADTHRKGPMFGNAAPSPSGRSSARKQARDLKRTAPATSRLPGENGHSRPFFKNLRFAPLTSPRVPVRLAYYS